MVAHPLLLLLYELKEKQDLKSETLSSQTSVVHNFALTWRMKNTPFTKIVLQSALLTNCLVSDKAVFSVGYESLTVLLSESKNNPTVKTMQEASDQLCGMYGKGNNELKHPGAVDFTQAQAHNYGALLTMVVCRTSRSLGALEAMSSADPPRLPTGIITLWRVCLQ